MRSPVVLPAALLALLLISCSEPPPPPPPFHAVVPFRELMLWVIDPAADAVWESVQTIMTEKGTVEKFPKTDEEWAVARNGAATLAEAANLLMMEGRARDNKEWMTKARKLMDAAEVALKAADAHNVDALFAAGGDIFNACDGCHLRYQPPDTKPGSAAIGGTTPAAATPAASTTPPAAEKK
jgi:cytochrome c556